MSLKNICMYKKYQVINIYFYYFFILSFTISRISKKTQILQNNINERKGNTFNPSIYMYEVGNVYCNVENVKGYVSQNVTLANNVFGLL